MSSDLDPTILQITSIRVQLPEDGGFLIHVKGTKNSEFELVKQIRLKLVGESFWFVLGEACGRQMVATFKFTAHPMTLAGEMFRTQGISRGSHEVGVDVNLGGSGNYKISKHLIEKRFKKIIELGDPPFRFDFEHGEYRMMKWRDMGRLFTIHTKISHLLYCANNGIDLPLDHNVQIEKFVAVLPSIPTKPDDQVHQDNSSSMIGRDSQDKMEDEGNVLKPQEDLSSDKEESEEEDKDAHSEPQNQQNNQDDKPKKKRRYSLDENGFLVRRENSRSILRKKKETVIENSGQELGKTRSSIGKTELKEKTEQTVVKEKTKEKEPKRLSRKLMGIQTKLQNVVDDTKKMVNKRRLKNEKIERRVTETAKSTYQMRNALNEDILREFKGEFSRTHKNETEQDLEEETEDMEITGRQSSISDPPLPNSQEPGEQKLTLKDSRTNESRSEVRAPLERSKSFDSTDFHTRDFPRSNPETDQKLTFWEQFLLTMKNLISPENLERTEYLMEMGNSPNAVAMSGAPIFL